MREFETGATRSDDEKRVDPEGAMSPLVVERFAEFMLEHRKTEDGGTREADNWQKGIPLYVYIKGLWRHFLHMWARHRGWPVNDPKAYPDIERDICGIIFNASGYLHEILKAKLADKVSTAPFMLKTDGMPIPEHISFQKARDGRIEVWALHSGLKVKVGYLPLGGEYPRDIEYVTDGEGPSL